MFTPRHASARNWFQMGFYAALGVVVLGVLALLVWQLSAAAVAIAAPFVVGLMLALLLDPFADRLEGYGLRRLAAVSIVFGAFLFLIIGPGYLIVNTLAGQAAHFSVTISHAQATLTQSLDKWLKHHRHIAGLRMPASSDVLSAQIAASATGFFQRTMGGVQGFLQDTVTVVIEVVVTLIVAFFLLVDIDLLRARLFFLLPEKARAPLKQMGRDVGGVFTDYLRGLLIVCALYGLCMLLTLYGLALTPGHGALAGYALLVGTAAGVLYAIPYLGALTIALLTFLVALTVGDVGFGVTAVFAMLIANAVFDNVVTPRVVGGGVGLNPVVAMFSLVLGGELFHFWGMLLSVPIAASIQVILFRLFPKLAQPTPPPFLQGHGAQPDQTQATKVAAGDHAHVPDGPSELRV